MMLLTTVSKIKKVWTVAFVPRLLRGDQRCTPVSYAVLRKAHKSTNTSDDGEHDKKRKKNRSKHDYIFMRKKEPQSEGQKNNNDGDNVPEYAIEDSISRTVSPPVLIKETLVEKCQRPIENENNQSATDPYNIDFNEEAEKLKFEEKTTLRETNVEKCQRIIEKAFGRQKPKKQVDGEPYYFTDVDIDQTRNEIREAQDAKLKIDYDRSVDKPVADSRVQFGVYRKSDVEPCKEDALIPPLESQNETVKSTAKRGGTKESATNTDHYEDLNLMQQTLNIYLTSSKGTDDNMTRGIGNTDGKIDAEDHLCNAAPSNYYGSMNDTLPLQQSVLKEEIDKYVRKQEQLEDKLFCDMQHMYENTEGQSDEEKMFKKSETIGFDAQTVKFNSDMPNQLKTVEPAQISSDRVVAGNLYSQNYWQEYSEDTSKDQKLDNDLYWNVNTFRDTKILQATTAKETEEQLTQKIEHIDETPLVEAHKPKVEGFNVTPRVLGDKESSFNYSTDKRADNQQSGVLPRVDPNSYDEVAKRCLDTPTGKIDEILLKEMEKLGIPMTGRRSTNPSPVIEDDLVQMDVLKKLPRSTENNDIEWESRGYERAADKLFASRQTTYNEAQPDTHYEVLNPGRKFAIHPNQVLIDPFDKKSIARDTEEYDAEDYNDPTKKFAYFYIPKKTDNSYLLSKSNSPLNNAKENATSEQPMYDDLNVNNSYDGYASFDSAPQLQNANTNNIWGEEPSFKPDSKVTFTAVEKSQNENQSNPSLHNYIHKRFINKRTASNSSGTQGTPEKTHMNYYNEMYEGYTNNMGSTASHFYMPGGKWDNTHIHNMAEINRTNVNVSDGLWDEQLLEEHSTKLKKKSLNKKWNQDHLQHENPLAYNVTHHNPSVRSQWDQGNIKAESPSKSTAAKPLQMARPLVLAGETCRIEAETEFAMEQPQVYTEFRVSMPEPDEKSYEEKMQKVATFLQAEQFWESARMNAIANLDTADMPAVPAVNIPDTLNTLPKLNEAVSLTELLRRVRERSRIIECRNELRALGVQVDPIEGKCGGKSRNCPPMAPRAPPSNPMPSGYGIPQLKPRPPCCKPKKKPRTNKCSKCEMDMSLGLRLGPQLAQAPVVYPEMVCEMNVAGAMDISLSRSRADLTDDIIDRLQALGKILGVVLRQGKAEVLENAVVKHRRGPKVVLARDYEPWAPIPSWPTPKKAKRHQPPCTPGCKIFPPTRATFDPPCDPRPCKGFPKKTFAVLDCFAVSLGENKVYDLGEF